MNRRDFCLLIPKAAIAFSLAGVVSKLPAENKPENLANLPALLQVDAQGDLRNRIQACSTTIANSLERNSAETIQFQNECTLLSNLLQKYKKEKTTELHNSINTLFYNTICPKQLPNGHFPNNAIGKKALTEYSQNLLFKENEDFFFPFFQNFDAQTILPEGKLRMECRTDFPFQGNFTVDIKEYSGKELGKMTFHLPENTSVYSASLNKENISFQISENLLEINAPLKQGDRLHLNFGIEIANTQNKFGVLELKGKGLSNASLYTSEENGKLKNMQTGQIIRTKYQMSWE